MTRKRRIALLARCPMSNKTLRASLLPLIFAMFFGATLSGPARAGVGVWTPVGPGAGWVNGIASITVHPGSPGTVWAGVPQGGLYRSTDRGINWQWTGGPFISQQSPGVSALAADPSRPGALWAATPNGFFRTEDGGAHWLNLSGESYIAALGIGPPNQVVNVPGGPGVLYVVNGQRLLASTDGGRTWTILYDANGTGAIERFAAHPAAPRVLYLAVLANPSVLLQSVDGGQTWAPVTSSPSEVQDIVLAPGAVYIAVRGQEPGILRSTDQGRTWRPVLGGTPSRQFDVHSVTIDPRAPRNLYASGFFGGDTADFGLWVSRNAGDTWTKAGPVAPGLLRIDSAGALYGVGNSGGHLGLLRSLDGGAAWSLVLQPPSSESEAAQIAFRPGDPARAALAVGFTLFRSVNGGIGWKLVSSLWGVRDADLDPADPNRLIAITPSWAYLSEDAGKTWRPTSPSLWYLEILARVDRQTLLAGGVGIYRSGDNGRSWQTT